MYFSGDKEFHIPYMKPLEIPEVGIEASRDLKIKFYNCKVYGLENSQLKQVK